MQFVFGSDRVEMDGTEWGPGEYKIIQTSVGSCKRLDRNAVPFEGADGLGYDVDGRAEVGAWDHVEEVEDDVENVTVLWHDDSRVNAII